MGSITLKELRISNFRSIKDEQILRISPYTTLIGPNNSGKTNALRAITTFFGGYDNAHKYDRDNDIPFDRQSKKTSVIGTFEIDSSENWFWDPIDKLHELQSTKRTGNVISLYLYFTNTNTPVYNFFTNVKRPQDKKAEYSRILRNLVADFINRFEVIYIPSEKSITDLYTTLLAPRINEKVASILMDVMPQIRDGLNSVNSSVNEVLTRSGVGNASVQIEVPGGHLESIVGNFGLTITDDVKTSYLSKGRGLQAAVFYASLHWVDERIKEKNKTPIWLLEEPESYMHPNLAKSSKKMVRELADKSTTIVSTHSMQFMPYDTDGIHGFNYGKDGTTVDGYIKYEEACNSLKRSLGLRFSDYYGLALCNVFVEGKWDTFTIRCAVKKYNDLHKKNLPHLSKSLIVDKGGTTGLVGFIKAVYEHIRKEVAAVTVFDGDVAGDKARRALQGYFSGRGEFTSNRDFVVVRTGFDMEGLFPDSWIIECQDEHPKWFQGWSLDAMGSISPFSINDDSKGSYAEYMSKRLNGVSSISSAPAQLKDRLFMFLSVVDNALGEQLKYLGGKTDV